MTRENGDDSSSIDDDSSSIDTDALQKIFESFGIRVRVDDGGGPEMSGETMQAAAGNNGDDDDDAESNLAVDDTGKTVAQGLANIAKYTKRRAIVEAIVRDLRWPNFLEDLWFAVVNAGGGAAGAFMFYKHYISALPFLESKEATVVQIVNEFFTVFGPTCPTANNEMGKAIVNGVGRVVSNGADLEGALDHLVWSSIFFVGTATLVAFPFANYVSGGRVDARTQFRIISLGIVSALGIDSLKNGVALVSKDKDDAGPLASFFSYPGLTTRVPRINRVVRFYERSGLYPPWAKDLSRQLRAALEATRFTDCTSAEKQLSEEKEIMREQGERQTRVLERGNDLMERQNRLLAEQIQDKRTANFLNGLWVLGNNHGTLEALGRTAFAALGYHQFAITAGDAEEDAIAEPDDTLTMKEYLDFLARLGMESVAEPEPAKMQTYESETSVGKKVVHHYAAATRSELAEKFLDTLNCWNLLGYRDKKFYSMVTDYGDHEHALNTEEFKGVRFCVDDHELLSQLARLPNTALSYTPTKGRVGLNGQCTLKKFQPEPATAKTSNIDVREKYHDVIREILERMFAGWNEMTAVDRNGLKALWHSGHDGSAYALYLLEDEENEQEVIVPVLRHEPSKTNTMASKGKPTTLGGRSNSLDGKNHRADPDKIDEFLDDLFATASAYEVSKEFGDVTCKAKKKKF